MYRSEIKYMLGYYHEFLPQFKRLQVLKVSWSSENFDDSCLKLLGIYCIDLRYIILILIYLLLIFIPYFYISFFWTGNWISLVAMSRIMGLSNCVVVQLFRKIKSSRD